MNKQKLEIIETRKINQNEYGYMLNLLKKINMPNENFIKNCQTLILNKIDDKWYLLNGYDALNNLLYYNDKSNLVREFLHVASSNNFKEQGIIIKPCKFYSKSRGHAFNEGITDMFLELSTGEVGFFVFEKLCAKFLAYIYGIDLFKVYFQNDDLAFREQIDDGYMRFLLNLDDYSDAMTKIRKLSELKQPIPNGTGEILKIYMETVLEDLLILAKNSEKEYKAYLNELLKAKDMKQICELLGGGNWK